MVVPEPPGFVSVLTTSFVSTGAGPLSDEQPAIGSQQSAAKAAVANLIFISFSSRSLVFKLGIGLQQQEFNWLLLHLSINPVSAGQVNVSNCNDLRNGDLNFFLSDTQSDRCKIAVPFPVTLLQSA